MGFSNHYNATTFRLKKISWALKFSDELNKDVHFFIDCQSAIASAVPYKSRHHPPVIRQMTISFENKEYILLIHWILAHRDFKGNELAEKPGLISSKRNGRKEGIFL